MCSACTFSWKVVFVKEKVSTFSCLWKKDVGESEPGVKKEDFCIAAEEGSY
jgi:hypothetical protein